MANRRTNSSDDGRLDRIEQKLDDLQDALVNIARSEERINNLTTFSKAQHESIKDLMTRMDVLESDLQSNRMVINTINKLFWILITAAASSMFGIFFFGGI